MPDYQNIPQVYYLSYLVKKLDMTNNDVLKKLRVALMLRDDEIVDILKLVDFRISKAEIGAFCRKEGHPKYKPCGDQVLRNFLNGLVIHLRGTREQPKNPKDFLAGKLDYMKVKDKAGGDSEPDGHATRQK
jgi:hypothetical protein